jgi:hypothetical protein
MDAKYVTVDGEMLEDADRKSTVDFVSSREIGAPVDDAVRLVILFANEEDRAAFKTSLGK